MYDRQNQKIDMVYLWCDGNDTSFKKRKDRYLCEELVGPVNEEATGELRFFDNEELKYSLRSLEMYASWINHVYIVTDRQKPKWLNEYYEKVTIVDHSDIMPKEIIPCFNSTVIEYYIPYIQNLSEKFLYGNDDMFFARETYPTDFFNNERPIVRVKQIPKGQVNDKRKSAYDYYGTILNALDLLNIAYGKNIAYELHHNIDAYRKTLLLDAIKRFKKNLGQCVRNRFRKANDIQRILFNLDMVYSGNADLKIISKPNYLLNKIMLRPVSCESIYETENSNKIEKHIRRYNPKFFCINSDVSCSVEEKIKVKEFLEKLYPVPSRFEL